MTSVDPKYLFQRQQIQAIPAKRSPSQCVQWLSQEEVRALFDQIDSSTFQGLRDLALLVLLYDSAARVSEIIGACASDLRVNEPASIRLHGKGNKFRVVPLMEKTVDIVKLYLDQHQRRCSYLPADRLFVNRSKNPLTRGGVTYILKKYVQRMDKSKGCSSDTYRLTRFGIQKPSICCNREYR